MTATKHQGGRPRGSARETTASILLVLLAALCAGAIGEACGDSEVDLCTLDEWPGGVTNVGFMYLCCCVPQPGQPPPTCGPGTNFPPANTCPNFDGGTDGGDAAAEGPIGDCIGQCVLGAPEMWNPPALVWIGPELEAPQCPESADLLVYEGHASLSAPDLCGACGCDPPTGTCGLPGMLTASNSATCPDDGPGATLTPFDPPSAWDGGCTTNEAVDGGELCDGGPCVQSLTIAPLTVNDTGCTPTQIPITTDPPSWGMFARVCQAVNAHGSCSASEDYCSVALPGPGFHLCVASQSPGDRPCSPLGPYQDRYVFYNGFQDTRACVACSCGQPSGSTCTAELTVYSDDACTSAPVVEALVDSDASQCHDVTAGASLGSKSTSLPTYMPGACLPSGGPIGSATPVGPSTLCCLPSL
jgi:hypothetical protein